MFESYSDATKQAIIEARRACEGHSGKSIRGRHLLVGLLSVDDDDLITLLAQRSLDPTRLRKKVSSSLRRQKGHSPLELPFLGDSVTALRNSHQLFLIGRTRVVRPIHLLLSLATIEHGPVSRILRECGIEVQDIERLA